MTNELAVAIDFISQQPCAICGQPLGQYWTERYNPTTERLDKVHSEHKP